MRSSSSLICPFCVVSSTYFLIFLQSPSLSYIARLINESGTSSKIREFTLTAFSHMVQILTLRTLDPLLILNCFAAYRLGFKWYSQLFSCWLLEHLLAFSQNLSSSSWCTLSMRISFLFIAYRCHRGCLPRIGGRAQNHAQNILCKLLIFWPIV